MSGINKVILIGNLGRDPEIRAAASSTVATVSLAVSESWKDKQGNRQERTEWVNLVAWGPKAELAQKLLHKGSKIFVEGKLQTRSWDDKSTGQKHYATEVIVDNFQLLDARQPENAYSSGFTAAAPAQEKKQWTKFDASLPKASESADVEEDLPF